MMKTLSKRHRVLTLVVGAVFSLAAVAIVATAKPPAPCQKKASPCKATSITSSIYTGGPPYPVCLQGADLYTIAVSGFCNDTGAFSGSGVVCSVIGQPFSFNANGRTHTFGITPGNSWEDFRNGDCSVVTYKVS